MARRCSPGVPRGTDSTSFDAAAVLPPELFVDDSQDLLPVFRLVEARRHL